MEQTLDRHDQPGRVPWRLANEGIAASVEKIGGEHALIKIVCECSNESCRELVSLSLSDFNSVRTQPGGAAVLPGHLYAQRERILSKARGFWIVAPTLHA